MQEVRARYFAGIPDSLLIRERDLQIDLTFYETELFKEKQSEKPESVKVTELQKKLLVAIQEKRTGKKSTEDTTAPEPDAS